MKEYQSTTGGRHTYNSDFKNLQELALAAQEIFRDCKQNFVISGCEVKIDGATVSVGKGYVYIDNKICKVAAASGLRPESLCIVARQENGDIIPYADGNTDIQYINYYAEATNTPPGNNPCIIFNPASASFPNLKTAFFNTYAVCKNVDNQFVGGSLIFTKALTMLNKIYAYFGICLKGNSTPNILSADGEIQIQNNGYKLCLSSTGLVSLKKGEDVLFTFSDNSRENNNNGKGEIVFNNVRVKSELNVKDLYVNGNNIERLLAPLGTIQMWAGKIDKIPDNFRLCDGTALSCSAYSELYSVLGDAFNTAPKPNGTVWAAPNKGSFRLPDLRQRFIAGYDSSNYNYNTVGKTGGKEAVTLTANQSGVGSHSHWYACDDETKNITGYELSNYIELRHGPGGNGEGGVGRTSPESRGAYEAHENRPPFYTLAYIIRVY